MRKAVFSGSFDPFTIGHWDIVARGLSLFDKIVIAVGENKNKFSSPLNERVQGLKDIYCKNSHVEIFAYTGLTASFVSEYRIDCILRGIRDEQDLAYERIMATVNEQLFGIETVFLFSRPQYAHISSSMVRELLSYGCDVSSFLPQR